MRIHSIISGDRWDVEIGDRKSLDSQSGKPRIVRRRVVCFGLHETGTVIPFVFVPELRRAIPLEEAIATIRPEAGIDTALVQLVPAPL